jgi:hypothetical protein
MTFVITLLLTIANALSGDVTTSKIGSGGWDDKNIISSSSAPTKGNGIGSGGWDDKN